MSPVDTVTTSPQAAGPTPNGPRRSLAARLISPTPTPGRLKAARIVRDYSSLALLVVLISVGAFLSPVFFTPDNLLNITWAVSVLGILALGQCILIVACMFDMSVAFAIGLCGVVTITAQNAGVPLLPSVLIGMLSGVVIGVFNGLIVVTTKANPFLVTLGSSSLVYAISLTITRSKTINTPFEDFTALGRGRLLGGIHYSVLLFLALAIVFELVLRYTTFGRSLFVIGLNQRAAHLEGIRVSRTLLTAFILCGAAAALAGLIMASRNGSTVANAGLGLEFESIIAVVLGGTSLFGGRGGALRTVVGVLVLGVLNNLMILMNFPVEAQQIAKGSIFLLIVWLDSFLREDRR